MYYSALRSYDVANGPGVRVTLFVSGCDNKCKGCFQPETWNPKFGKRFTEKTLERIISYIDENKDIINGITILGGDPFFKPNISTVSHIVDEFRNAFEDKDIWVYTGYTLQHLYNKENYGSALYKDICNILSKIDYLIDGRFEQEKKDLKLQFRGSSNQRLIDMNKTKIVNNRLVVYHKNRLDDENYLVDEYFIKK